MQEIERKFLVKSEAFKIEASASTSISQGFLNADKVRTVRVRLTDDKAFLTIKGETSRSGMSRLEWETEIPVEDAKTLLTLCEPGVIEKRRYYIQHGEHTFEVDEFYGENQGLIIAEVELQTEQDVIERPDWLGSEVTGEVKYYNAMLSKHPFSKW
jgi:CYTH domain-containing protein